MKIHEDNIYDKKIRDNSLKPYRVKPAHSADGIRPVSSESQRRRKWNGNEYERNRKNENAEVADDFHSMEEQVIEANRILEENNSNLRMCIFRDNEAICLDVVRLTEKGHSILTDLCVKDITHEKLLSWLTKIHDLEGIVVDRQA